MTPTPHHWPPHTIEVRNWRQAPRGGTRADRMVTEIATSVPPRIADLDVLPARHTLVLIEEAMRTVGSTDSTASRGSTALGQFMARNESVASSKIEHVEATGDDFARATVGNRANSSATSMVAAAHALHDLARRAGGTGTIDLNSLLEAHRVLMEHDEYVSERRWAGRVREEQNWIGGSDHSPRNAAHVPPAPEHVGPALEDLLRYANRDDVPALAQAAIVHAQFESIHPFTDGNGRIGRALIGAVLQRRGVTRNAVVPLASGLFALRAEYFESLNSYRDGDIDSITTVVARSVIAAATESLETLSRLAVLPEEWRSVLDQRAGSSALQVTTRLLDHPILRTDDLIAMSGGSTSTGYNAISVLEQRGIIREVTGRKRDRVWVVSDVVSELEDLDLRIQKRVLRP